ncbi:MAG: hypothetical protein WBP48_12230, partial [Microbacterium sp.]
MNSAAPENGVESGASDGPTGDRVRAAIPAILRTARPSLATGPTPLHPLDRLRAALGDRGPRLWIKRDDLTGLALGGNKARKLEYLLAEARA